MRRNAGCVSRDVISLKKAAHGRRGSSAQSGLEPKRPVEKFLFLRQNDKDLSSYFYQTISMNHDITKTAEEVLWDFLTGIASLKQYSHHICCQN